MPERKPLIAVHVTGTYENGDLEYYHVGQDYVTAVEWGGINGPYCELPSIRVFKNGDLYSEHPFAAVMGVYYGNPEELRYEQSELEKANA